MSFDEAAARAVCDAATEGPWRALPENIGGSVSRIEIRANEDGRGHKPVATVHAGFTCTNDDAAFIAQARTLLPQALDEITRLRGALEDIHQAYCVAFCCPYDAPNVHFAPCDRARAALAREEGEG